MDSKSTELMMIDDAPSREKKRSKLFNSVQSASIDSNYILNKKNSMPSSIALTDHVVSKVPSFSQIQNPKGIEKNYSNRAFQPREEHSPRLMQQEIRSHKEVENANQLSFRTIRDMGNRLNDKNNHVNQIQANDDK